ncbi:hypothetical protein MDA_GLEAN10023705 [Myotis davidii]|uniref:Uncharacterized protein n=1 Tax=Myotis davidii TaxID=225400 RepID=L5M9C4_MYODS|nr:hypothetical protein MDA_GLEAN10023705 [Myotis davidii]
MLVMGSGESSAIFFIGSLAIRTIDQRRQDHRGDDDARVLSLEGIPHVHNMLVEALQLTPTLRVASLH